MTNDCRQSWLPAAEKLRSSIEEANGNYIAAIEEANGNYIAAIEEARASFLVKFQDVEIEKIEEFSTRIKRCLRFDTTVERGKPKLSALLFDYSIKSLLRIPNLGRKSVGEIQDFLMQHGLKVGMLRDGVRFNDKHK
jgi:DNA-directed RNA polymerase alpha subunit